MRILLIGGSGFIGPHVASALEREYPGANTGIAVLTSRLADRLVDSVRLTLLVLFGAVAFLLLMICANIGNLLLSRTSARSREFAVRTALGAGSANSSHPKRDT